MNWYKKSVIDSGTIGDAVQKAIADIPNTDTIEQAETIFKYIIDNTEEREELLNALGVRYIKELDKGYQNLGILKEMISIFRLYLDDPIVENLEIIKSKLKKIVMDAFADYLNVNEDYYYDADKVPYNNYRFPNYLLASLPEFLMKDNDVYNVATDAICYLMKFPEYNFRMNSDLGMSNFHTPKVDACRKENIDKFWVSCARKDQEQFFIGCLASEDIIKKIREQLNDDENKRVVQEIIKFTKQQIYYVKEQIELTEFKKDFWLDNMIKAKDAMNDLTNFFNLRITFFNVYKDYPEMQKIIREIPRQILGMRLKIKRLEDEKNKLDFEL